MSAYMYLQSVAAFYGGTQNLSRLPVNRVS